jgi:hypothetical protein
MRKLMVVAMLAAPLGCAHRQDARNLAQRQPATAPTGEFENGAHRGDSRNRPIRPAEPPIVTPPVP